MGFLGPLHQGIKIAQLGMTYAKTQRQVDEEDDDIVELQFDDQSLGTLVEVVKARTVDAVPAQKSVPLLLHEG